MDYRIDYWNKKEADPIKFLSIFRCTTEPIGGGTEGDDEGELVDWNAAVVAVNKTKEQMIEKACRFTCSRCPLRCRVTACPDSILCSVYSDRSKCDVIESLIKTMEE